MALTFNFEISSIEVEPSEYEVSLESEEDLDFIVENEFAFVIEKESYSGPYIVVPSKYAQVLNTEDKFLDSNITVEAIPSNYGLITWNGAVLTVS